MRIEAGGEGVVAHVGLHALGAFADRLGVGDALSARIAPAGERLPVHDRGKVLIQAMLMLAGGGEACSDIEVLRA
ncbi:MAG TPA: IS1380 family transposase, partial [Acidimicrobiales bacterium]|nr:IS1380 family transposase [Acidimicrobiales bacterium]